MFGKAGVALWAIALSTSALAQDAPRPHAFTQQYFVGKWADDGPCTDVLTLFADGTFTLGKGSGRWKLDGNQLTVSGGTAITLTVAPIDANSVRIFNSDGTVGMSKRCP